MMARLLNVFAFVASLIISSQAVAFDNDPSLCFIKNINQWNSQIHYAAQLPAGQMMLQPGKFGYLFTDWSKIQSIHEESHSFNNDGANVINEFIDHEYVEVEFLGANTSSVPVPLGQVDHYYNFFIGEDQNKWASNVPAFTGVLYPGYYPGIDLKVYRDAGHMKYDFIVEPGGDPVQILFSYSGAIAYSLEYGDLVVSTSLGKVIEKDPVAYQFIDGRRVFIPCEFRLEGDKISFDLPEGYDPCYELIIDPVLIFSTYSGSSADNWGSTATPGENGTLYSAGVTNQYIGNVFVGAFVTTPGAFQTEYGGGFDIGILKYDSLGTNLLYASYLGGSGSESAHSLIVNPNHELIILGTTSSLDFPTSLTALDRSFNGGTQFSPSGIGYQNGSDIILAKISRDGSQMISSTYLGGSGNDGALQEFNDLRRNYGDELRGDVATDSAGNIYVSSVTSSVDFPVKASFGMAYHDGLCDAVIIKLNSDLSDIIWSGYLGGSNSDASYTIKFDSKNHIFVAGGTSSDNFPVTPGSFAEILQGDVDGWIAKIKSDGTEILHSTFTGTSSFDQIYFLDLNTADEVFVYGQTSGSDFPIVPSRSAVYNVPNSGQFLQKFDASLSSLLISTCFGSGRGIPDISPTAFMVNDCDKIYMAGWGGEINIVNGGWNSNTLGLQVSSDAIQTTSQGSDFYFIVLSSDASKFIYGTYLGGSESKTHVDGGTSRFEKSGVVYHAVCSGCSSLNEAGHSTSDFPTTESAWSRQNRSLNCNNAAFKLDLSTLKAIIQPNAVDHSKPGLKFVCLPDSVLFENKSFGGKTFRWDFGDGSPVAHRNTHDGIIHSYKQPGTYKVTLQALDESSCNVEDITHITINVFDQNLNVQDDDDVCENSSYQLNASGGNNYQWVSQDSLFRSDEANPIVAPLDTMKYYVTITDANGCFKSDSVTLSVISKIDPEFEFQRENTCDGRPAVTFTNRTDSIQTGDELFFNFGDGSASSDLEKVTYPFPADNVYNVVFTGKREHCIYEKALQLPVFSIKAPNVITPDGSGKNEFLTIQFGPKAEGTPADYNFNTTMKVYNRWGTVLFESDNYQFDWKGEGLEPGIYFYEAEIEEHGVCKTWLHIIK